MAHVRKEYQSYLIYQPHKALNPLNMDPKAWDPSYKDPKNGTLQSIETAV